MNPVWQKLAGTQVGRFALGLLGVVLKNNSGHLQVRNPGDSAFADAQVKDITVSNNSTGFGVTVTTSGSQAANYSLTLPVNDGSPGEVLATDGTGILSWVSAASTDACLKFDSTSFAFGSGTEVTMFTLPANAVVDKVSVIVDTAFNGAPSLSVGVDGGNASKYVGSGDVLLTAVGRYDVYNTHPGNASPEDLEIAYTAGGATVGAGRVLVSYATPT
jgi:hypothetical protein